MIRIGNQTACRAATPREPFDYAVASGFDAFEWFPDKKPDGGWDESDLPAAQRREIRETARARGMRLSVHARWQANPLEPASAALFEKDLELARDLGAALFNVHLCHERGISAYVEAIRPLIGRASEAGLQLSIENTPHHSPENFNELFLQLRRLGPAAVERVGMCFDLGHANLCAATRNDYLKFLDRLAPHVPVIHLHLHENYGDADTHLPLFTGPAGRDDSGIRGLIARLRQRSFSGSIIFEQWPRPPSLLNEAREKLLRLLAGTIPTPASTPHGLLAQASAPAGSGGVPPRESTATATLRSGALREPAAGTAAPQVASAAFAAPPDEFVKRIVAGNERNPSWRGKLEFIRELLAGETALTVDQLVDIAVYLRFLGTGQIPCAEDGRHFRPAHHARIAQQIQERLAKLSTPETAFIVRKIYPWLPSSAREFQRAEPLTRIRDIAHRNDIPAGLKREIKTTLQNKLHRCAGPEDLATSAALLERIAAPGAGYAAEFVEQFRIFHRELKEFFNASSLDERLQTLLPAASENDAHLIRRFLAEKTRTTPAGPIAAFKSLTELRRRFLAEVKRRPGLEQPEFLLADIGLDDFAFVLLSEILNAFEAGGAGPAWEPGLEVLQQAVVNLELSRIAPEECGAIDAELSAWRTAFAAADREQLLRLKATVSRARRLAESCSDRIMAWFPRRARTLGRALGVPPPAIQIFAEAEIRGHLIFQLSKLATLVLRRIREELAQPAWDVIVPGEAAGRVRPAGHLDGNFPEPALVLLDHAEGDEDIPAGVAGIVLAHDLPHLSHFGVRARQAGVVLLACEETARFAELKRLEGKMVLLTATPEQVEWRLAERAGPKPVRAREVRISPARLLPAPACIPLEQALADRGGNKADGLRRLAELARRADAGFAVPPAVVVPFGVMEEALRAAPAVAAEYRRILSHLNAAPDGLAAAAQRLRELIQQLRVPEEIVTGVAAEFGSDARLMVRSSANDEDLAKLAGAGLYESVANVPPAGVAPAVRAVWASLWTRRAGLSRQQAGIPQTQAHIAVLIQQMLAPDYSFILHTVNPLYHNRQEAYAEIVLGLGETLASAATRGNPYRLVCQKNSGRVTMLAFASFSDALRPNPAGGLARKTVDYSRVPLSLDHAVREKLGKRLAAIAQLVETAFHGPQDIEGVVKDDEIYLVQSRPQQGLNESR